MSYVELFFWVDFSEFWPFSDSKNAFPPRLRNADWLKVCVGIKFITLDNISHEIKINSMSRKGANHNKLFAYEMRFFITG